MRPPGRSRARSTSRSRRRRAPPAAARPCARSRLARPGGRARPWCRPASVEWPTRQAALIAGGRPVERGRDSRRNAVSGNRRASPIRSSGGGGARSSESGARLMPQLPVITVVTPWLAFAAMSGVASSARSSCVCTSIKPGATIMPATSISRAPAVLATSPIAAMRSPATATSARNRGPPRAVDDLAAAQNIIGHRPPPADPAGSTRQHARTGPAVKRCATRPQRLF